MTRFSWSVLASRSATLVRDSDGRVLGRVSWDGWTWCGEVTMGGSSVLWCCGSPSRRRATAALKARIASYEAEERAEARRVARHAA